MTPFAPEERQCGSAFEEIRQFSSPLTHKSDLKDCGSQSPGLRVFLPDLLEYLGRACANSITERSIISNNIGHYFKCGWRNMNGTEGL